MGRMMILGEAKCQNTFCWDFSPKHNLEDENIKCYKACVMSPSKTHSIVLFCKIWCLQESLPWHLCHKRSCSDPSPKML